MLELIILIIAGLFCIGSCIAVEQDKRQRRRKDK